MAEAKVYAVGVGNFNVFKRKSRQAMKFISKLDGIVGVHPCYPYGQLILFKTENDAKVGRNRMNEKGIQTGHNICEVYVDEKYVEAK